jgi:hypothetical protein
LASLADHGERRVGRFQFNCILIVLVVFVPKPWLGNENKLEKRCLPGKRNPQVEFNLSENESGMQIAV